MCAAVMVNTGGYPLVCSIDDIHTRASSCVCRHDTHRRTMCVRHDTHKRISVRVLMCVSWWYTRDDVIMCVPRQRTHKRISSCVCHGDAHTRMISCVYHGDIHRRAPPCVYHDAHRGSHIVCIIMIHAQLNTSH